ncbi:MULTISPECIES: YgeY family selenium metabolism-linked hydrolase [unclassified Oceanispirochaeta]|uniref:YgeY family selenium metabolism-linked hydrolase n=1 Tax=unclassified Oceanispirochaeta TaxID=2635722 RepID=UPI000E0957D0|nr:MULTISPECIES: YgeY family selenium metabolism-linked hydrolase [unclassified Oceanispirochaeta]MBF9015142.1 YgeY family selenium metabolism-linked hydrolase [Oceanispirochaeta sp. M2]NPD71600.1 YgeY family selenium metabolism-linked hydrolase [Oceanispirochaeta sp. M1]RDG33167.1 YgeY family selenium metabolism-linked hydrolase [Oceanispirochaeta sp. M1]
MNNQKRDRLIELCVKLIQTPSVTGKEKDITDLLSREMKVLGFDEVKIDGIGNIIGKISGTGGGRKVLFDGHLDTVSIANRNSWTKEPFGAEIEDGKIYGRGASDMKGALAAMIMAAVSVKENGGVSGDIYVSGTVFEEVAEGYSLASVIKLVSPDVVIIGEATELNLNIGQRGRAELLIKTKGVPAHSSNPEIGVNAVYHMMNLISEITALPEVSCPHLGKGNLVLTDIISSPYPGASVIPEECIATFDRRLITGENPESVLQPILDIIERIKASDSTFKAEATIASMIVETYTRHSGVHKRFAPAWLMDRDHEFVKLSLEALRKSGKTQTEVGTYSFCTNGSCSAGISNIPTLGFGPSREDQAHVIDEYILIDELEQACDGYVAIAKSLAV